MVGGLLTGSLALLADAGHLASDVGAIAIGLVAARLAGRGAHAGAHLRPAAQRGAGRARERRAAAGRVGADRGRGAQPARASRPTSTARACWRSASSGLAGNVAATWVLAAGEREDLNLEGVLRHSAGDALSSLGVVVAGALVLIAGWNAADPIASLVIAALIAAGSWRLLKEPVDVLLESAPAGTDVRGRGGGDGRRARRSSRCTTCTSGR